MATSVEVPQYAPELIHSLPAMWFGGPSVGLARTESAQRLLVLNAVHQYFKD
jgi:hypothetical protein